MTELSELAASLAAVLRAEPLREKILLAPSRRVGRQWLDQASAAAPGFANIRISTVKRLIIDLAEPVLARDGLRPASRAEKTRLAGIALGQLAEKGAGYFSRLPPTLGLAETILSSIEELDGANVVSAIGIMDSVEPPEKAEELAELIRKFRSAKRRAGLAGEDAVIRAASKAVKENLPLLIAPMSTLEEMNPLEWGFYSQWPQERRMLIAEDEGGVKAGLSFLAADSIANEAREVLSRIQEAGTPLDQAEAVCLDPGAYIPAICSAGLEAFGGRPEDLPITFSSGIPAGYSRPARLLAAWLEWLRDGLPPEGLARMLEADLLGGGWREHAPGVTAALLALRLRALPIGGGPEEYRLCLAGGDGPDESRPAEKWLARLVQDILPSGAGGDGIGTSGAKAVLDAAERVLSLPGLHEGKLDAYARTALVEAVREWRPLADWRGFDAATWLKRLGGELRVMGLGPMPGRMHVSDIASGGHSGRRLTFILGVDDTRFPIQARQDPVLLDRERMGISPHLARSGQRRRLREKTFTRLLARLRGEARLSYATHDPGQDREQFPATMFTRLAEERAVVPSAPAGLVSAAPAKNLSGRQDWLAALLEKRRNRLTAGALEPWFPGYGSGLAAAAARRTAAFTEYDGCVPDAGADFFSGGCEVSPTDLELLAACPREFFFRKILGIRPPERYRPAPGRWLEGNERGSLLHELFQNFLEKMEAEGTDVLASGPGRAAAVIGDLLAAAIRRQRKRKPSPDKLAAIREERELAEAAAIFLETEAERQIQGRPLHLEVSLGGGEGRTPWDRAEAVELRLPEAPLLRLRGRVDRIDRLHGHGGLAIIDYKTGRSDNYSRTSPFRQGRHLQPYLYIRMLELALADRGLSEPVRGFSYFFPMPRDEGRTVSYSRGDLAADGERIVSVVLRMLAAGCFPFTTDAADAAFSDYLPLHGNVWALAAESRRKAESHPGLREWAELRKGDA